MSNYTRGQKKIVIYYDGHDYWDVPSLALKAVKFLEKKGTPDVVVEYEDEVRLYAKHNKSGVTVRQID